jgi:hypothetical protein
MLMRRLMMMLSTPTPILIVVVWGVVGVGVVVTTTWTRMQKLEKCMYSSAHTFLASYNSMQSIEAAKEK